MTSLTIIKIASDALLFGALIFLSLRVLRKQSSGSTNLLKIKELELSLKEIVKEADDASRNFTEELLSRKRDLERILEQAQAIEGRLGKANGSLGESLMQAETAQKNLALATNNSIQEIKRLSSILTEHEPVRESRETINAAGSNTEILAAAEPKFEYSQMLEPPSFSRISEATAKRVRESSRADSLSSLIERTIENTASSQSGQSPEAIALQNTLRSIAKAAEKSIKATSMPQHLEEALSSTESGRQKMLREDPRLGVLGGLRRTTQVV